LAQHRHFVSSTRNALADPTARPSGSTVRLSAIADPAVGRDGIATTYNRDRLQRAWQAGSGGIAHIIHATGGVILA
jgi:hypothetical protein